jgi:protein-L-isoaspartate(D-aspartate) O-methyltransferase
MPSPSKDVDFENLRRQMVDQQLRARGISDAAVLRAMEKIPREAFVPDKYRADAYYDGPLPIGANQTISQPYIVALMSELLSLGSRDKVLEIGTGSGYQSAVLHVITSNVYSIERIERCVQLDAMPLKSGQVTAAWDGLKKHPLTQLLLPPALRAFPNH